MNPAIMAKNAIFRIGEHAALMRGDELFSFRASIQPRFSGGGDASGPAGWGAAGRYMLYAPADAPAILAGDEIMCRGNIFHVTKAEDIHLSGELVYRQAMLMGEESEECKA